MNELEKIKTWETLKAEINKIHDPKTKNLYHRAFLARAIDTWGFNPENPASVQKNAPSVDDWDEEFVQDIQDSISYGFDTREEKRKKTVDKTRSNIKNMLRSGYTIKDIPDEIRTPYIEKRFWEMTDEYTQELMQCADDLIRRTEND